jgi:glycosyltransferase involved in cell wall biosynthesis
VKVAFVVPRYGVEVRGGAEHAARQLAERVVGDLGWEAEALTTCAVDSRTWANELPAGMAMVNGVIVHRFPSESGRDRTFDLASLRLLATPARAAEDEQQEWLRLQGPSSRGLLNAVAGTDADLVVFYPYLYEPTVKGVPLAGRRAVLHPAAHDEPPLRLPMYQRVFESAAGLVYHTESERRLVERTFAVHTTRQIVLGLGVDDRVAGGQVPVEAPYLLYVGRVDNGKGVRVLVEFFTTYKQRRPGPLRLVLAGAVHDPPPVHAEVDVLGEVDEATKWALYERAEAFVNPSAYESFSIVLMEAWECGTPALVNGASEVLRDHCIRSGGGLWFDGYARFESSLDRLLGDPALRTRLGAAGRSYVDQHYRWPALIQRYRRFLEGVAARVGSDR